MKNFKRAAAIAGVVLLLAVFCLPMIFAFGNDAGMFRASAGMVILVPVIAYVFWMMYRVLNKRNKEVSGTVKNVIFDVGQVLMGFDWEEYLKKFDFDPEEYKFMATQLFNSTIWDERDRGLYPEEEYVRQFVAKKPEYEEDIEQVLHGTGSTLRLMDYAETWAEYLKSRGYHLYILSNLSEYMLEQTRKDMKFLPYMDGAVFSCEVKQLKPEEDIYKTLLERYQLDPKECVFIDDRAANCETANRLGIRTIEFRNFKQAARELEELGVK